MSWRFQKHLGYCVLADQWSRDAYHVTVKTQDRVCSSCFLSVSTVLSNKGRKKLLEMKNIWAYVSVKHMVSICLLFFPAGYQHRNFIKHFSNWVKACYGRKKKLPLTAHIFLLEFKEPGEWKKVERMGVGWQKKKNKTNKNDMTSSYK